MPKHIFGPNFKFIQHQDMLSFEEITRLTQCFVALGVTKIRLTGGEPLLRKDIESLVSSLSNIKTHSGSPLDLTMTTNGSALINKAQALFNAGLKRITLSLDAIDNDVFMKINGVAYPVDRILNAIEQALKIGFSPIKVNAVIRKGMNENQILPLARYFRHTPIILRFIEYMDAGSTNGWNEHQIIPSSHIQKIIHNAYPIEPIKANYMGETAKRWRYKDGGGELGIISSITEPFCADCTRIRLSTDGKIYPCLFATEGLDLRPLIRSHYSDHHIIQTITEFWKQRSHQYSKLRQKQSVSLKEQKIEMHYIGG